jgi:hypothetical protein
MDTCKNWCIKLDAENRDVVIQYLNEKYICQIKANINGYYGGDNKNWIWSDKPFGTELTFEEFKTHILGEGYKSNILGTSKNNPPINKFLSELDNDTKEVQGTPSYYDNSKGSLYQFAEHHKLNAWEFDIVKRIVRCREKGNFIEDLEKTKKVIDLYLKEFKY